jgi:cytochrome c-type biogenesis protein CcmF
MAFLSLIVCYVISDFSVLNVVNNSHTAKPLIYKISGAWGNHEGSMLLWICSITFFSALFAYFSEDTELKKYTLVIQAFLTTFFIAFVVFTSNPFERIFPAPLNGYGLNPILQDIGLAMHPPMLYLGYVGFSLAYSGAISALILGRIDKEFAYTFRPWVMMSWSCLSLGIGLGSWWAYRELGWGGFWFWDPVENSSLMPWLTASALIHSLIVLQKYDRQKHWVLLLSIMTFTLSMIGTFLVRSNIITSVHSFAQDPRRGLFILGFLGFATSLGLLLYALKAHKFTIKEHELYFFSRPTFILFNNLFLSLAAFIVILGTLYPSVLEIVYNKKMSVGAPYFNSLIGPLSIGLLLFVNIGTQVNWQNTKVISLYQANKIPFVISLIITCVICWLTKINGILYFLGIFFSIWLIIALITYTLARRISFKLLGMLLSHIGFAILVLSISLNAALEVEVEKPLKLNESLSVGKFKLTFTNIDLKKGKNYIARIAEFKVHKGNNLITTLYPETRFFPVELQQTTESAIHHALFYDLYIATGELEKSGLLMVRSYYKSMMSWVWLSGLLIFLGGACSLISNRKNF